MRRSLALVVLLLAPLVTVAAACAGDDPPAPGPKDLVVGSGGDGSTSQPDAVALDAPLDQASLAGLTCTQAELDTVPPTANGGDFTSQTSVAITFPSDSTPKQYTNRCVKVKVGTVVTFKGAFAAHPLDAKGGDTPSPIPRITDTDPDGGALALTMTAPGNYGFVCDFHPGSMFGVIQVVP